MADQAFKNALLDLDYSEDSFTERSKENSMKHSRYAGRRHVPLEISAWQPVRKPIIVKELSVEPKISKQIGNSAGKQVSFEIRRSKDFSALRGQRTLDEGSPSRGSKDSGLDKMIVKNSAVVKRNIVTSISPRGLARRFRRKSSLASQGIGQAILIESAPRSSKNEIYSDVGDFLRKTLGSTRGRQLASPQGRRSPNNISHKEYSRDSEGGYSETRPRFELKMMSSNNQALSIANHRRGSVTLKNLLSPSWHQGTDFDQNNPTVSNLFSGGNMFKSGNYGHISPNKEADGVLWKRKKSRPADSGSFSPTNDRSQMKAQLPADYPSEGAQLPGREPRPGTGVGDQKNLIRLTKPRESSRQGNYDLDSIVVRLNRLYQSVVSQRGDFVRSSINHGNAQPSKLMNSRQVESTPTKARASKVQLLNVLSYRK